MRHATWMLTAAFLAAATTAGAQTVATPAPLSPAEIAIACAPPPTLEGVPDHAVRIVGTQDTTPRSLFGNSDLLVLDGGTKAGVSLGQRFFVRRAIHFGGSSRGTRTVGWIHVVAVNVSTAIAQVDHVCGAMLASDYLAPFVAPAVPAELDAAATAAGEPDFAALGHVVGADGRSSFGHGDFALIDRGTEQGVMAGQRFAIYRDVRLAGVPLATVGEAVVISTSGSVAVARITAARDAVYEGDYVAPRK
jgi:hypothetical protein